MSMRTRLAAPPSFTDPVDQMVFGRLRRGGLYLLLSDIWYIYGIALVAEVFLKSRCRRATRPVEPDVNDYRVYRPPRELFTRAVRPLVVDEPRVSAG